MEPPAYNINGTLGLAPGLYYDVKVEDYHADKLCDEPTLSRGELVTLVEDSPLHCYCSHPRLGGGAPDDPTNKMDFGSLCHRMVLDRGNPIEVFDADTWQTKAAKEFRATCRENHIIPVLTHQYELAEALVKNFWLELARFGLLDKWHAGKSEVVAIWRDGKVLCRCMFDRLYIDEVNQRVYVFDPKFGDVTHPSALPRQVLNQNYHVQQEHYLRAIELLKPELTGRMEWYFLFTQVARPYAMTPVRLHGEFKAIAISKIIRGIFAWEKCMAAGVWPSYTNEIVKIEPPTWALNAEIGADKVNTP